MARSRGVSSAGPGTPGPPQPGLGRPARPLSGPLTATDDRGVSYQLRRNIGPGTSGTLELLPDPPHPIRRLEVVTAPSEPAIRIDLNPPAPPGPVTTAERVSVAAILAGVPCGIWR
jgi:hypothetical protein